MPSHFKTAHGQPTCRSVGNLRTRTRDANVYMSGYCTVLRVKTGIHCLSMALFTHNAPRKQMSNEDGSLLFILGCQRALLLLLHQPQYQYFRHNSSKCGFYRPAKVAIRHVWPRHDGTNRDNN